MNIIRYTLLATVSILVTACVSLHTLDTQQVMSSNTIGLKQPQSSVFTSGQPTKEQIKLLSEAGVKNIVNLRPDSELNWNEAEYVTQLGMQYHHIPISGADDITEDNARLLQQTLTAIGDEAVLVHCGSGNRVGALAVSAQ